MAGALRRLQAHKAEYMSQEGDGSCSQAVSDSLVGGRGGEERGTGLPRSDSVSGK